MAPSLRSGEAAALRPRRVAHAGNPSRARWCGSSRKGARHHDPGAVLGVHGRERGVRHHPAGTRGRFPDVQALGERDEERVRDKVGRAARLDVGSPCSISGGARWFSWLVPVAGSWFLVPACLARTFACSFTVLSLRFGVAGFRTMGMGEEMSPFPAGERRSTCTLRPGESGCCS